MTEQNEKPKSILEALGVRAEEDLPEPTQEEIVTEALMNADLETRLGTQYPDVPPQIKPVADNVRAKLEREIDSSENLQGPTSTQSEKMTLIELNSTKIPMQETVPVLNISPLPVPKNYIQESVEKALNPMSKNEDLNLRRLLDYVYGPEFSLNWVRLHLQNLSRIPEVIPVMTLWDVSPQLDIAQLIYDVIQSPGYVENVWPHLRIVMGSSRDNVRWTAGVCTTIALFDAIRLLPYS